MNRGVMCTYKHKTLGLSAYYGKRRVLEDGILTEPIVIPHRGRGALGARPVGDSMREAAALCPQARQEVSREQSHAWGRHANNTKSVRWLDDVFILM